MSEAGDGAASATAGATGRRRTLFGLAAYSIFALSGIAGLIYESLWARYLGLFVGHTAYAQILVLVIFMGGMALGALAVGARAQTLREPLQAYARIEILIGVLGLAFHSVYMFLTRLCFEGLFPALDNAAAIEFVKWSVAGLLILPQSVLLGTTFPLMSAGVLRRTAGEPGRTLSLLYFSNSLGAAIGVLIAGFVLIRWIGLPGALLAAGFTNLLVAALATGLGVLYPSLRKNDNAVPPDWAPPIVGSPMLSRAAIRRLLLGIAFGTAVASFIYEVGWIRMLSQVLGSASHSFELMLSAFILGLALGALWIRRRSDGSRNPVRLLGRVQILMGLAALATLPLYLASFTWMEGLLGILTKTNAGYSAFSLARYSICLAIMLPATFCAGMTLPLITRILISHEDGERAIGGVYGLNTLGSIFGAVAAGLLLLPWLGMKNMIVLGALLDMALGCALLSVYASSGARGRVPVRAVAFIAATAVAATIGFVRFDPRVISSGPFRLTDGSVTSSSNWKTLFYEDGRTATISVVVMPNGNRVLTTNGKPDASLPALWFEGCSDTTTPKPLVSDSATQALAPMIALAHHAEARRAAVIGFGSGMSTHFMLSSPRLESVETIEIEPATIRGARHFYPANALAYDDPRSKLISVDAKTHFATQSQPYDVIFSEPSNPWVSGVASLFTTEFYGHVRRSLGENGVFGQWLHLYEIDDDLVLSILGAIHESFSAYEVFMTSRLDMLIVATTADSLAPPNWGVFSLPRARKFLCRHPPLTAAMLEAARVTHRGELSPLIAQEAEVNSDFFPTLEMGSERARFLGSMATGFLDLHQARHSVSAPFFDRRFEPAGDRIPPVAAIPGMRQLALAEQLAHPEGEAGDEQWNDTAVEALRFRHGMWNATVASGIPPASWREWITEMAGVEESVHGRLRGRAVESFYDDLAAYLDTTDAPAAVRDVVDFRRGMASWDFPLVVEAGSRMMPRVLAGAGLIRGGELLQGLVVAQLRLGDPVGARRTYEQLTDLARPEQLQELRYRLLAAYIELVNLQHTRISYRKK
jgi:predicted membrane-bound spermidine synthase